MRLVLIGDGESPHLLKWARALAPRVELWAASSRGFLPGFDACLPPERRLALHTNPRHAGGNVGVLAELPRLMSWLRRVDADWLHAHYLTSHGTLAWAAKRLGGLRAQLVGSAWGSDILVAPARSRLMRLLTRRVLRACTLCTSDAHFMTERMQQLGAGEVLTFPFGLESLPPPPGPKSPWRCFANRGLEPIYRPERVLQAFAELQQAQPEAELVVANAGSLRTLLEAQAKARGLHVRFVGRLGSEAQAREYAAARWYFSLPESDSTSVSVLEAMAHGCLPVLSDLPANRELARAGAGVLIDGEPLVPRMRALLPLADAHGLALHRWVADHALFPPAVAGFVRRLHELTR
ncbi:glycosyltransferase [Inhella sp.]|uniref:glycosyltransferase n=1 Tax=Inhella sp. TaxID=1921806 RepID=UPI0035B12299